MVISLQREGNVRIIRAAKGIVIGEDILLLRRTIRDALNEGFRRILLNIDHVNYIDSSGLGELVNIFTIITSQGGALKLVNGKNSIKNVMQLTKIITIFEVFQKEKDALTAFGK